MDTNKEARKKIAVAQRSTERSVLNVTRRDKWQNATVRRYTRVVDILEKAEKLKWKWAGQCQNGYLEEEQGREENQKTMEI